VSGTKVIFIYVTCASEAEAHKIAKAVVTDHLAACANIIPGMKSIYRWEGRIEEAHETVLILKTRAELFEAVEKRVKELHSAKTPCIVSLPLAAGNKDYLQWIAAETNA
jgi:periplasmic divalent cation tolerance protein